MLSWDNIITMPTLKSCQEHCLTALPPCWCFTKADLEMQTQAIGLAPSSSHGNSSPTVWNQDSILLGILLGDRKMSGNQTSCQTSLFSILISFLTNESYLLTKYHLSCLMCLRISQQRKDGLCLEKLFFCYRNIRIWRLIQKLFLSIFLISYLSPQFQLLEKEASKIFHKKRDWLSISLSLVAYKQYISFKRSLFLLELLELHKLLSYKGNHNAFDHER